MTPSPEQIKAAMPAMRTYLAERFEAEGYKSSAACVRDGTTSDEQVLSAIGYCGWYPGGVAQFIADQEERRG